MSAIKREDEKPKTGWGECFGKYLSEGWSIMNMAENGLSTRRAIDSGIIRSALSLVEEGDAVLLQFGHNENKEDDRYSDPWTGFYGNLLQIGSSFLRKGASVYFITPIERRRYESGYIMHTHGDYPAAMKAAAARLGVPVIDMTTETLVRLQALGEEDSRPLFMLLEPGEHPNYPDGSIDNTHFTPPGAEWACSLIYSLFMKLGNKPGFLRQ